jgi:hypothetical protein
LFVTIDSWLFHFVAPFIFEEPEIDDPASLGSSGDGGGAGSVLRARTIRPYCGRDFKW